MGLETPSRFCGLFIRVVVCQQVEQFLIRHGVEDFLGAHVLVHFILSFAFVVFIITLIQALVNPFLEKKIVKSLLQIHRIP